MVRKALLKAAPGVLAALLLATVAALPGQAGAQIAGYPNKPITLIVPFPAGGTTDTVARLVGQELSGSLGRPVVVENKPGANGNIGSGAAARATPDGYTLLLTGVGSNAINHGIYPKMPYDSRKDFAHITLLSRGPNILVVNPEFPAKSFQEFVDLVKANPDKYNYASSGNGSSGHLAMELLKQTAGLKLEHVPYKGGAPALTDVIGGHVPVLFINQDVAYPHIQAGKLRVLGVASTQRNPLYPDTPTIAESGFPGFEAESWFGLAVPAGTPKEIVAKLNAETVKALQTPSVKQKLEGTGFVLGGNSPEQVTEFVNAEIDKWAGVARSAGLKATD